MPQTALIVIDMLNTYDHEDADRLVDSVRDVLGNVVDLRDRAAASDDALLIYVNDNHDAWASGRQELIEQALGGEHPELVEPIAPTHPVPFLPKGRHSIFYETGLSHLLQVEDVERVVLCGQVTEQCILYSALDAYLRGYDVVVPPDAVAHIEEDLAKAALKMIETNMHGDLVEAGRALELQRTS
jgi:nicotinamidase-related amidase